MRHIRGLDGLRAVAILTVFLHHQYLLNGGWVGVELFFVLSGLLITGILRRSRDSGVYWRAFYLKRATRILPAMWLLITFVAWHDHAPLRAALAYYGFLGNFVFTTSLRIFQLGLIWSLAVEEHFYLLFPFAVRLLRKGVLLRVLLLIVLIEPVLRFAVTRHFTTYIPIYFFTCFHLDGLAMGAILALLAEDMPGSAWVARWSGWAAISFAAIFGALSFAPVRFDRTQDTHLFNFFGYTLVSLTCMGIVAYVRWNQGSWLTRLLEQRILVFLGVISYGLYLYHLTAARIVMHLLRLGPKHAAPLSFGLAVLLSWLSFRFFESPITQWGRRKAATLQDGAMRT